MGKLGIFITIFDKLIKWVYFNKYYILLETFFFVASHCIVTVVYFSSLDIQNVKHSSGPVMPFDKMIFFNNVNYRMMLLKCAYYSATFK